MDDERIRDEAQIAAYVETARILHDIRNSAVEIADPPVVLKTASGARVLAWLPVEDEDLTAQSPNAKIAPPATRPTGR